MTTPGEQNGKDLDRELSWLVRVIDGRFRSYFDGEAVAAEALAHEPPDMSASESEFARFVTREGLEFAERLALALAIAPLVRPHLLDVFGTKNRTFDRPFTEFGGVRSGANGAFLPTGETLAFVLGGVDLAVRFEVEAMLDSGSVLATGGVLHMDPDGADGVGLRARLRLAEEYTALFTLGRVRRPAFGASFPAHRIETQMSWEDLVLHPATREQVEEISTWTTFGEALMRTWGMAARLRPGYRSLFYGPPGTGKTMTACLLGKTNGCDVYRIDLSLVVSKYIGETEKNLARVFDHAQNKGWILFFDEADALFGQRGEARDAHDRYANQEVAFLLQRIESFDGIAILASNLRGNIDRAFARRFESTIHFPLPRAEERIELWRRGFSARARFDPDLDLEAIAREYELSGGGIMNVVRAVSLQALKDAERSITESDLVRAIRRELAKEGRSGS